jgi:hypothetical protein
VYQVGNKDKINYTEMHGKQNIKVKLEAATAVELLMMGVRTPETC